MKSTIIIFTLVAFVAGILVGRIFFTPETEVSMPTVIVRESATCTLLIDTQDGPLQTYKDVYIEENETIQALLVRLTENNTFDAIFTDGIQIQGYKDTSQRQWRVYVNGIFAAEGFAYQPARGDSIELQYEAMPPAVPEVE